MYRKTLFKLMLWRWMEEEDILANFDITCMKPKVNIDNYKKRGERVTKAQTFLNSRSYTMNKKDIYELKGKINLRVIL